MSIESLADAFRDELRDVLSAERQLTKALPKLAKKAHNEQLRKAFEEHHKETEKQVERVEEAFKDTGKAARAKTCEAMEGLLEEAGELMQEDAPGEVKDALLIAAAQKVEHYEIATYGTLCAWAEILGYDHALKLLKQNMGEEEKADKKLTELSKQLNQAALV